MVSSSLGRPTLRTLAESLGLSVTTVSRALKDGPEVHIKTRERVQEAAKKIGYQPNMGGVKLKTGATFSICAALSSWDAAEVGDASAIALLQGMQERIRPTNYLLSSLSGSVGDGSFADIDRIVSQHLADGLILDHTLTQDIRVKYLLERNFPFVSLGRTELFSEHPYIDTDMEFGAEEGVRYLLSKGHTSLALVSSGNGLLYAKHRERGFRNALIEAGISPDDCPVYDCFGMGASELKAYLKEALKSDPRKPTAFMTENTLTTLGAVAALYDSGRRIGQDVDLFGNDGSHLTSFLPAPISYTYYPHVEIGGMLVEFLFKRLAGEPVENLQHIIKPQIIRSGHSGQN